MDIRANEVDEFATKHNMSKKNSHVPKRGVAASIDYYCRNRRLYGCPHRMKMCYQADSDVVCVFKAFEHDHGQHYSSFYIRHDTKEKVAQGVKYGMTAITVRNVSFNG